LCDVLFCGQVCIRLITLFKTEQEKLQSYPREIVKLKRQMIQIIVTVVLVFFVCHTPYRALAIWTMFEEYAIMARLSFESFMNLMYITRILLYSNHAINPFVYNFVSRKFRQRLKWLCCQRRQRVKKMYQRTSFLRQLFDGGLEGGGGAGTFGAGRGGGNSQPNNHFALREREEMLEVNRGHRNDFLVLYENLVLLD
jgi:hypothetical protein